MQRTPIILEGRHRLLHMRASLERNCGQSKFFIEYILDLLSIPEYVIKKRSPHGHSYGETPENKEYHLAHNLKKRCLKMDFTGFHDRFLRDHVFRERMIQNSRGEDDCLKWDDLAEQDFTYRMSESEYFHYRQKLVDLSQKVWKHWRTI